jgi:hypothetical protein
MTHLVTETDTLYRNDGAGMFEDWTARTGLAAPGMRYTSWGTRWLDYDNDGVLDLFVANGGVRVVELARASDPFREPNQLFHGIGAGRYQDVSASAGGALAREEVSRGAAFGDLDNDGDTDIVVATNDGPARILINEIGQDAGWVGIGLAAAVAPRDALGAEVVLERPGSTPLHRRVRTDGSFASAHDPRLLFGLGRPAPAAVSARVIWPDGAVEAFADLATGRYLTLRQGAGRRVE